MNSSNLTIGSFANWDYDSLCKSYFEKIEKFLGNTLEGKVTTNRLNSFVVFVVKFGKNIDSNFCRKTEKWVVKQLSKYSAKIRRHKNRYLNKSDKDLSKTYRSLLRSSGMKRNAKKLRYDFFHSSYNFQKLLNDIHNNTIVFVWDQPGFDNDRVVFGEEVFEFDRDLKDIPLNTIIDELLIMLFAKRFIQYSEDLYQGVIEDMNKLTQVLKTIKLENSLPTDAMELLDLFIGTISSFQETSKLFRREVKLVDHYADRAQEFLNDIPSATLQQWISSQNFNGEHTVGLIDRINSSIFEIKSKLKQLDEGADVLEMDEIDDVFASFSTIFPKAVNLSHWSSYFKDLPSFTSLEHDIGYEEFEDEVYPSTSQYLLEGKKLFKTYQRGNTTVYALRGVDISIEKGEFVIIRGPSGAGKTTLLNQLAGLDYPSRGAVFFEGNNIVEMNDNQRADVRRQKFSFIFQNYALIPHLTAYENTQLPLDMGEFDPNLKKEINDLLRDLGIYEYKSHKPALLSGGQMQRLGIARALIKQPEILFADEPTGDLDQITGKKILDLFKKYHNKLGITIIMVTHDESISEYADREILIQDGQVVPELKII